MSGSGDSGEEQFVDLHTEAGVETGKRSAIGTTCCFAHFVDLHSKKSSKERTVHELAKIVNLRAEVAENRRKGAATRSAFCVAERFDDV